MDATVAMSVKGSQGVVTSIKLFDPVTASVVLNIKTHSEVAKVHRFLKFKVYESFETFQSEQESFKAAIEAKSVAGLKSNYLYEKGIHPFADVSVLHGGVVRRKVDLSKEEVIISQEGVLYIPLTLDGVEVGSYFEHHINSIAEYKNCLILRRENLKKLFSLIEFRDFRISFKDSDVFVVRNEAEYEMSVIASAKQSEMVSSFIKSKAKNDWAAERLNSLDGHIFEEIAKDIEGLKKLVSELEEIQKNPAGLFSS